MKRANGTGSIVRLSGNRRKPYCVKVSSRDKWGRIIQRPLSYHARMAEAQEALDEYNHNRAAGLTPKTDKLSITLGEIYDLWSPRKFASGLDQQGVESYQASWLRLSRYKDKHIRDITLDDLQAIIDEDAAGGRSKSTLNNDKILMRALFKYAMKRDIIMKDYSEFVELPTVEAKFEKGALTDLQMHKLEEMAKAGYPWADTVLMLCYTGFRVSEFLALTRFSYDREEDALRGGSKTAAGKNRVLPVHPKIKPYLQTWLAKNGNTIICGEDGHKITAGYYREHLFKPVAEALDLPQATPHWCRHTFSSRLHAAGAPDLDIKRLLGHADGDVTDHYTHTSIEQLRRSLLLLA